MAFKQTDPGRYAYAFEALVMSGNIVTIGKVVGLVLWMMNRSLMRQAIVW